MLPRGDIVGGPSAVRPQRKLLSGVRFDLDPLNPEAHAADLFAASHGRNAEDLWTYLPYGPFENVTAMRAWLTSCAASHDPLFYAVIQRMSRQAVGMCSLMSIAPDMRRLEIGHVWYSPEVQGTGVNSDVARMLMTESFERLGYRRVEWKCDSLNARSRAAALKLGFTYEGLFRQHMIIKGRNRDTAWFSILDREWPTAKAALQRWLPQI